MYACIYLCDEFCNTYRHAYCILKCVRTDRHTNRHTCISTIHEYIHEQSCCTVTLRMAPTFFANGANFLCEWRQLSLRMVPTFFANGANFLCEWLQISTSWDLCVCLHVPVLHTCSYIHTSTCTHTHIFYIPINMFAYKPAWCIHACKTIVLHCCYANSTYTSDRLKSIYIELVCACVSVCTRIYVCMHHI
jgi:hypothetical protein